MALVKGISLFGAGNQVSKIIEDNTVIQESIFNILTTRKGEIPGKPQFGTGMHSYLFEPNLDQYWDAVKLEIMNDVMASEPRAYVYNAEFMTDGHNLSLFIYFISLLDYTDDIAVLSELSAY